MNQPLSRLTYYDLYETGISRSIDALEWIDSMLAARRRNDSERAQRLGNLAAIACDDAQRFITGSLRGPLTSRVFG